MRIVGRDKLDAFCSRHPDARTWVGAWLQEVAGMSWTTPQELRSRYATASFLAGNVVIFNVKGNSYRLETAVAYRTGIVDVSWIGSHAGYDARNRRRGRRR